MQIFVSYSQQLGPGITQDVWPKKYVDALRDIKVDGHSLGERVDMYVYQELEPGEDWLAKLEEVKNAKILLPIVSRSYFESVWCFWEWFQFATESTNFQEVEILPVTDKKVMPLYRFEEDCNTNELENLKTQMLDIAKAEVKAGYARNKKRWSQGVERMVEEWVIKIFTANPLGDLSDANAASFGRVGSESSRKTATHANILIRQIQNIDPKVSTELAKLAELSTLALGLDRFSSGGWGFSMGSDFERDDDGSLLLHGRYELNLLVMRALRSILPSIDFKKEADDALLWPLGKAEGDGQAEIGSTVLRIRPAMVTDRMQNAVALSAMLNAKVHFTYDIGNNLKNLKREVAHSPVNQRWIVESGNGSSGLSDIVFFDFLVRAKEFGRTDSGERMLKPYRNIQVELDKAVESASNSLRLFFQQPNPFIKLYNEFFLPFTEPPKDETVVVLRPSKSLAASSDMVSFILYLRVLFSREEGCDLLSQSLRDRAARGVLENIENTIEVIVENIKNRGAADEDISAFLRVFPTYVLCVLDFGHHVKDQRNIAQHSQFCGEMWQDLVASLGSWEICRRLNAAGWASNIVLAQRLGVFDESAQPPQKFGVLWKLAEEMRKERKEEAITAVGQTDEAAFSKFDTYISSQLQKLPSSEAFQDARGLDPKNWRPLFAFGGRSNAVFNASTDNLPEPAGILLVDGKTDRVLSATAGFNTIYIQPFCVRLGLGLNSLERMIFELGENDKDFISALAQSVVLSCWPLDKVGKDVLSTKEFEKRSNEVRDAVYQHRAPPNDPGISFTDLLKLRTVHDGQFRFVMRTCSAVHPYDWTGIPMEPKDAELDETPRLILWIFKDVTSWVKSGVFNIGSETSSATAI